MIEVNGKRYQSNQVVQLVPGKAAADFLAELARQGIAFGALQVGGDLVVVITGY